MDWSKLCLQTNPVIYKQYYFVLGKIREVCDLEVRYNARSKEKKCTFLVPFLVPFRMNKILETTMEILLT